MFDVLFAGVAVLDFDTSVDWYRRLFGRDPDVVAHDTEVMWRITDRGWVYVKARRCPCGTVASHPLR